MKGEHTTRRAASALVWCGDWLARKTRWASVVFESCFRIESEKTGFCTAPRACLRHERSAARIQKAGQRLVRRVLAALFAACAFYMETKAVTEGRPPTQTQEAAAGLPEKIASLRPVKK